MNGPRNGRRAQEGIALAVVLVLLVVVTLLALAAMRGTLLQERMSSNVIDRGKGFQAAEAALRQGEGQAAENPRLKAGFPTAGCGTGEWQGYCAQPDPTDTSATGDNARWDDANWEANSRPSTVEVGSAGTAPRYMVELLQTGLPATGSCTTDLDVSPDASCTGDETIYRITARSAADGRADVTLQSTYVVP